MASNRVSVTPAVQRHIEEARLNYYAYLKYRNDPQECGWAVVRVFYCAVVLIKAYEIGRSHATGEAVSTTHHERNIFIRRTVGSVWTPYKLLLDVSRGVRYDCHKLDTVRAAYAERWIRGVREVLNGRGVGWTDDPPTNKSSPQ